MSTHYPGGGGGPSTTVHMPDYTSEHGAAVLVARIRAYWAARGKEVSVWSQLAHSNLDGNRTFVVRSAMVGGQP